MKIMLWSKITYYSEEELTWTWSKTCYFFEDTSRKTRNQRFAYSMEISEMRTKSS